MNSKILNNIAESKSHYHKKQAKMPFEEKVKIIVELQKIDAEKRKRNRKSAKEKYKEIWRIQ